MIREEIERNPRIGLLVFSRRFGQPAATMAGILNCRGRWCVVIDVDLQDPPEMIEKLLRKAEEGFDVVTARRRRAKARPWSRRFVSAIGYSVINRIAEVPIPRNTGDFRIMSRRVVEELRGLSERHGFLRGLVSLVGFPQTEVSLRARRTACRAGKLQPLSRIAEDRVQRHLRILHLSAAAHDVDRLRYRRVECARDLRRDRAQDLVWATNIPWAFRPITVLVLFIGGVQLAAIGVLGEYIGRIYDEVRRRPFISSTVPSMLLFATQEDPARAADLEWQS